MSAILIAMAISAQGQPAPQAPPPLREEGPPARAISPGNDTYFEDFGVPTAEARATIQRYGACVANRSAGPAADVLTRDFTTRQYQQGLRVISRNNQDCFRRRGRMQSSNLLFAGAIAEYLLEQSVEPLNVRLARAASRPATQAFSISDRVAICVVRSVPDDIARLFATEVATDAELAAARSLGPAVSQCNADQRPIEVTPAGLRAILATAAFRTLHGRAPSGEPGN